MVLLSWVPQPIPPAQGVAKAWVMASGAMVSVDAVFSDWFAFKPEDLLGSFVSALVVEHKRFEEFLKVLCRDVMCCRTVHAAVLYSAHQDGMHGFVDAACKHAWVQSLCMAPHPHHAMYLVDQPPAVVDLSLMLAIDD